MLDLAKLNTLTKYPSIPTYHKLGAGKLLREELNIVFDEDEEVFITEKIDGANGRIVFGPLDEGWLIGSREQILAAPANPVEASIVSALMPIGSQIAALGVSHCMVFYFEVYGGKIGQSAKNYSKDGSIGARCFDAQLIEDVEKFADWPIEKIASWRDRGNQEWVSLPKLLGADLTMVPHLSTMNSRYLPTLVDGMRDFLLGNSSNTKARLDLSGEGRSEGFIVRNADRSKIAKVRHEDYDRWYRAQYAK